MTRVSSADRISVLMPAKNASKTINLAIRSTLLALSKFDSLFVIVDEHDKETLRRIEKISDPRIKLIMSPIGSTLPTKLNIGLRFVDSKYLGRMDADDVCLPWRFRFQRRQLQRTETDVVSSTAIVFGFELRPLPVLPQIPVSLTNSEIRTLLLRRNPIMHPTVLMKTESLEKLGGYSQSVAEDYDLWLRAAVMNLTFRSSFLPTILYRFSSKSLSRIAEFRAKVEQDSQISLLKKQLSEQLESSFTIRERKAFHLGSIYRSIKLAMFNVSLGKNE